MATPAQAFRQLCSDGSLVGKDCPGGRDGGGRCDSRLLFPANVVEPVAKLARGTHVTGADVRQPQPLHFQRKLPLRIDELKISGELRIARISRFQLRHTEGASSRVAVEPYTIKTLRHVAFRAVDLAGPGLNGSGYQLERRVQKDGMNAVLSCFGSSRGIQLQLGQSLARHAPELCDRTEIGGVFESLGGHRPIVFRTTDPVTSTQASGFYGHRTG